MRFDNRTLTLYEWWENTQWNRFQRTYRFVELWKYYINCYQFMETFIQVSSTCQLEWRASESPSNWISEFGLLLCGPPCLSAMAKIWSPSSIYVTATRFEGPNLGFWEGSNGLHTALLGAFVLRLICVTKTTTALIESHMWANTNLEISESPSWCDYIGFQIAAIFALVCLQNRINRIHISTQKHSTYLKIASNLVQMLKLKPLWQISIFLKQWISRSVGCRPTKKHAIIIQYLTT